MNTCSVALGCADNLNFGLGNTFLVALLIDVAVSLNGCHEPFGKSIRTADANTVQSTGGLISTSTKLTTGVENGHNNLQGADAHLLVGVNRNTATVIDDFQRVVGMADDYNLCTVTSKRLVNRVIENLLEELVQTTLAVVSNIHSGTLSNGFQTL